MFHKSGEMCSPLKSKRFDVFLQKQPFPNNLFTEPDVNNSGSLPSEMDECDFDDWNFPKRLSIGYLRYSSIRNEQYDRAMTLLLHEEDTKEDDDELYEARL